MQDTFKKKINEAARDGRLSCEEAFRLAADLNCKTSEVGKVCNEMNIKIMKCQLGCF